ncbi:MAG TPA: AarF/UbiB family protein [Thermoanaerobaculia bacterium]|nr:AarF/UbiB family protein [Thermoanaerobaculia bacterium]
MLKAQHLGRYRDLALIFTRYGRKDFKLHMKPSDLLVADAGTEVELAPDVQARAKAFSETLKGMGPTYIKFGQLLSTRPDIVPPEYVAALEELQDSLQPFSFAEVEKTIESELKVRLSKAFESFEATPIAAASLGQVHRATLRDGKEVVVKVQRPGVRESIEKDLDVFDEIAIFIDSHSAVGHKMNLIETVAQVRSTLLNELSYVREAHNMEAMRINLAEYQQIYIPAVVHDLTTERVLTTELIHGRKVSKLTPLSIIDNDYAELAAVLTRSYLKQICVDGFWHSDPHPGNVFLRETEEKGAQLVLLDFGMVSRIGGAFQDDIIKLLLAVTTNRGAEVAETLRNMGTVQEGFDQDRFVREISTFVTQYHDADLKQINTGQMIFSVISVANSNEIQVPSELAMFAKTMLHLDSITRKLDPDFDAQKVIRDYAEDLVGKKIRQKFHPRNFYTALLDLNQLAIDLPRRARDVVEQTATGKLTLAIKLTQAEELLSGMQKIANRITVGLVLAALIVGSSLMMRVPTRIQLFGYPVLAMIGYLTASAIGLYLVISVLQQDRRDRHKARAKAK